MAKLNVSLAAAQTALDALTALLNAGGTSTLVIYDGTAPLDCSVALGGGNHALATFTLAADAFGDAADANPGAISTAASITGVNAAATGTASFGRILNHAGVAVAQFDVGVSAASCIVSSTSFVSGQPCTVTSVTIKLPEGDTF